MDRAPRATPSLLEASQNPKTRIQLRQLLQVQVADAVDDLMTKYEVDHHRKEELIEVGMAPFERVFSIFIKDVANLDQSTEYFFKYYMWWMRQAVVRYLGL